MRVFLDQISCDINLYFLAASKSFELTAQECLEKFQLLCHFFQSSSDIEFLFVPDYSEKN